MEDPFVLLVGGRSVEHNDSISSYLALHDEILSCPINRKRLSAIYYISSTGKVILHSESLPDSKNSLAKAGRSIGWTDMIHRLIQSRVYIFSLLHGNEGEDGCYQGISKVLDLPGNFGNIFSACISMSKWALLSLARGISRNAIYCPETWVLPANVTDDQMNTIIQEIDGRSVIIKPNSLGSSVLTYISNSLTLTQLKNKLRLIRSYDNQILVQIRIQGKEYTCGIIENERKIKTLPVVQIQTNRRFFGYKEKHQSGLVKLNFRKDNSGEINEIKKASIRLFTAIGFSNMCRFDFIQSEEDGKIYFLEANPLPGLSEWGIFPSMLKEMNMSRMDLVDICISNYRYHKPKSKVFHTKLI